MKYTKEQAEKRKIKEVKKYSWYNRPLPDVEIKNGYFIVASKMNSN